MLQPVGFMKRCALLFLSCVLPAGPVVIFPVVFYLSKPSHNNTKSSLEASLTENRAHGRCRIWPSCRENMRKFSGGLVDGCGLSLLNCCCCWHKTEVDWEIPAGKLTHSPFVWNCTIASFLGQIVVHVNALGTLSVSKSLKDRLILPYLIWNPYEWIMLDLIRSTADGSQSYYILLDIEPPVPQSNHNLFKYEYVILTANCIITYWVQNHHQPILLPLIGLWIKKITHNIVLSWMGTM